MESKQTNILVLGIGNTLMGDEGVGVYAVEHFRKSELPENITCLDGGTGSFTLLGPMQEADKVIIIDATINNKPEGNIEILFPKYSSDYPSTLTAHDIGLKDLLDAFYLLDKEPQVILLAVSIPSYGELSTSLSPKIAEVIPKITEKLSELINS